MNFSFLISKKKKFYVEKDDGRKNCSYLLISNDLNAILGKRVFAMRLFRFFRLFGFFRSVLFRECLSEPPQQCAFGVFLFFSIKYLHKCVVVRTTNITKLPILSTQNSQLKQMKMKRMRLFSFFHSDERDASTFFHSRNVANVHISYFKSMVFIGYYLFNSFVKQKAILKFLFSLPSKTHTHVAFQWNRENIYIKCRYPRNEKNSFKCTQNKI